MTEDTNPATSENGWIRVPVPIESEADRRTMVAVLASAGLEVRIVKERKTKSSAYQRYIEYRLPT